MSVKDTEKIKAKPTKLTKDAVEGNQTVSATDKANLQGKKQNKKRKLKNSLTDYE